MDALSGGDDAATASAPIEAPQSTTPPDAEPADTGALASGVHIDAPFAPAVLAVRWVTTLAAAITVGALDDQPWWAWAWTAALVIYATYRTWRPLTPTSTGQPAPLVEVAVEVALPLLAMLTTGGWESPFVFTMFSGIAVAGFARGFVFALEAAGVTAIVLTSTYLVASDDPDRVTASAQWVLVLLLVALITGYAQHISGEADRQHTIALDRLSRLANANALLFSLHRVAQTLPASLDIDEVLDTTIDRLKTLFSMDFGAILLVDDSDGTSWQLVRREGTRLPLRLATSELPDPLTRVLERRVTIGMTDLLASQSSGLASKATSGMYAVLEARGAVIGMVAVESREPNAFNGRDVELLRGLVESVALAVDNARWFSRLRTVGADEERTRIARDLHDRIGQSLAYLAFELDRLITSVESDEPVGDRLERLRDDVRMVIREVRDTLYDLRTDVSDTQELADVLEAFAERVRERSNLSIDLVCDRGDRLPLLQEREMWRIAQEAVTNVERHADAERVRVIWRCNGESAVLDITDDGQGFPIGQAGRLDSYGLLGMRERAASIGATLDISSELGVGTRVRCSIIGEDGSVDEAGR